MSSPKKPTPVEACVVLSGAGTLAPILVGAVNALASHNITPRSLVGTSAGSIVAALWALGYPPTDLRRIVYALDFQKMLPFNEFLAVFRKYLASNRPVRRWLQKVTLGRTMADCEIPLTCITTDLTLREAVGHSTQNNPDMPVWEAVLASMSIPDIFPVFRGRFVDGGVMDNLGVNFAPPGMRTIALQVQEKGRAGPLTGFIDEQQRLISLMLAASEDCLVSLGKSRKIPVVRLDAGDYGFLDRGMTLEQKEDLYQRGYVTVSTWLDSTEGKEWMA